MELDIRNTPEKISRKVWVEIGPGHRPGGNIIDRLSNPQPLLKGEVAYVAVDKDKDNLSFPMAGSVAHFELNDFAGSDFLDGSAEKIFLFNVFGEPTSLFFNMFEGPTSVASKADLSNVFRGLARKLEKGGTIVIGEHITPELARSLLKEGNLKMMKEFGLESFVYTSVDECEGVLMSLGFKQAFIYEFVRMHEAHGKYKGPDTVPFILILEKI